MYRKLLILTILLTILLGLYSWSYGQVTYMRTPSLSPDGEHILFIYLDDIWQVDRQGGKARRLTVHLANETKPFWSPDGRYIAFSSDRYGNYDIFVMPAEGGVPERLTYHSSSDVISGWTPDSKRIIFYSNRDDRWTEIYSVAVDGGRVEKMGDDHGLNGRISNDGKYMAYTIGGSGWTRKGYEGSQNADIWYRELDERYPERLTSYEGTDMWPMWLNDDRTIYFVSERGGVLNIWKVDLANGTPEKITSHPKAVTYPSSSFDGRYITYTSDGKLWLLEVASGETRQVEFTVNSDIKRNDFSTLTIDGDIDELELSPDGKRLALVARGEIFVGDCEGGEVKNISKLPSREKDIFWSKDGDALFFQSNRDLYIDIYRYDCDSKVIEKLTDTEQRENLSRMSPDGRYLAYVTRAGLWLYDMEEEESELVVDTCGLQAVRWAPDNRWIAVSRIDDSRAGRNLWLYSLESGEFDKITFLPYWNYIIGWSADGSKIFFVSGEHWREIQVVNLVPARVEDDDEPEPEENDEAEETSDDDQEVDVKVVFEGIDRRTETIYEGKASITAIALSHGGDKIIFRGQHQGRQGIYLIDSDGSNRQELASGLEAQLFRWLPGDQEVVVLCNGTVKKLDIQRSDIQDIHIDGELKVDRAADFEEIFEEVWLGLYYDYYDSTFHGVDWKGVYDRYKALLREVMTKKELKILLNEMIGQLQSSHLGCHLTGSSYQPASHSPSQTSHLGLKFADDYEGPGIKIDQIVPYGPADKEGLQLEQGDYIMAIDDSIIYPQTNYLKFLEGKAGNKVKLMVADGPDIDDAESLSVEACDRRAIVDIYYDNWVARNEQYVDSVTNGNIGYVHIRRMFPAYLRKFKEDLFGKHYFKAGLILDVRNNGGGNIHNELMDILVREGYAYNTQRGIKPYMQPVERWDKPIVVLINQNSFSDAEVFPSLFREMKLGKIVGVTTGGGVIGTSKKRLIDGGTIRMPFVGWYNMDRDDLENMGIEPDVPVKNLPSDVIDDNDKELTKAIEVILDMVD